MSAFLLRAAIVGVTSENNTATNIRLVTAYRETELDSYGELQIEASLPYDSYAMLRSGGDFLANLKVLSEADPNPLTSPCSPTGAIAPMPRPPQEVDTLERFFLWACLVLKNSLELSDPRMLISFLEERGGGAIVKIVARLPFDYSPWLTTQSIVCSMYKITGDYNYPTGGNFENLSSVDNLSIVGN
jgi:hypothetical protein